MSSSTRSTLTGSPRPIAEKPAFDLDAGYIKRAPHALPRSGTRRPWNVRHNYVLDVIDHRFDRIEEACFADRGRCLV